MNVLSHILFNTTMEEKLKGSRKKWNGTVWHLLSFHFKNVRFKTMCLHNLISRPPLHICTQIHVTQIYLYSHLQITLTYLLRWWPPPTLSACIMLIANILLNISNIVRTPTFTIAITIIVLPPARYGWRWCPSQSLLSYDDEIPLPTL